MSIARHADGGGKADGIAARIDACAQAGRRADTGEDIEARIGGIGNEIERGDFVTQVHFIACGDTGQQQRAPGRGAHASVAVTFRDVGKRV